MKKYNITKIAIILSFLSGFLSLALEVIWIRLFGFFSGGLPQVFSFTLAIFLLGIALGALTGKDICKKTKDSQLLLDKIGRYLLLATAMDLFVIISLMVLPQIATFTFIVGLLFCAIFRGVVFPIVHHLGTEQIKTGAAISNVYFANVLGSTIAPILVGFVFLTFLTTQQTYLLVVLMTLLVVLFCLHHKPLKLLSGSLLVAVVMLICVPEKMIYNLSALSLDHKLERVIENKYGIVQEYVDNQGNHIIYGGNMYDGHMNTSLLNNVNQVQRAYLPLLTNTDAKKVLVIGLASGSWAKVLTLLPQLEEMTIVELNPAYIELASVSKDMKDLLEDPRIHIITDDGRRYISRHPNEQYDLIVMNTTHYYRNQATAILSKQFLQMVKKQLKPTGTFMYNTTGFTKSFDTAGTVFDYVYPYHSMVVAAHQPIIKPNKEQTKEILTSLRWRNGTPLVENAQQQQLDRMAEVLDGSLKRYTPHANAEIITDENMINEYKYGFLTMLFNL